MNVLCVNVCNDEKLIKSGFVAPNLKPKKKSVYVCLVGARNVTSALADFANFPGRTIISLKRNEGSKRLHRGANSACYTWMGARGVALSSAVRNLSDTVNNYNVDISHTQCCPEGLIAAEEISFLGGIIILYCLLFEG
jgi:hypothetical protein